MEAAKHMDQPDSQPDPLIDEIRRIRTELHNKFPNDLKAYVDYINKTAAASRSEIPAAPSAQASVKASANQE